LNTFVLPNGKEICCLDRLTANYIYNEIFVENVYVKHGIEVHDGDVIFDVGANIGLFSLYVMYSFPGVKVHAFEPVPQIFDVLESNLSDYREQVKLYNYGLSRKNETVTFNYYPGVSGDSTMNPFIWERKKNDYLNNYRETVCSTYPAARMVPAFLRPFVVEQGLRRLYKKVNVTCSLKTLSEVISHENIERIDLVKIDAENAEWDVLNGINSSDWKKIYQLAIEVHEHIEGGENLGNRIKDLLMSNGFSVTVDNTDVRANMGVFMLYAQR